MSDPNEDEIKLLEFNIQKSMLSSLDKEDLIAIIQSIGVELSSSVHEFTVAPEGGFTADILSATLGYMNTFINGYLEWCADGKKEPSVDVFFGPSEGFSDALWDIIDNKLG